MTDPLADLPPHPDPDPNPGPLDLDALDRWIHERDDGPGCWACNPPLGQPMSDQLKALRFLRRASEELRARRAEVKDLKDRLCDVSSQVRALARGVDRLEVRP